MLTRLLSSVCCLILIIMSSGCSTLDQRVQQNKTEIDAMVQEYGPACSRFGYDPATDGWRNCVMRLDFMRRYELGRR